jgi:uncharacterized protein YjiS (DUF1127 family)
MVRTLGGRDGGSRFCADGRRPGAPARVWRALRDWRERLRRRRALAGMSGSALAELGIPPGLAAYEAGRWPWQPISTEWREFEEAHRQAPPVAPSPIAARGPARKQDAAPVQ